VGLQNGNQIPVQLDDIECSRRAEQATRQRTLAGTDLDQRFARLGRNRAQQTVDDVWVVQEMLAEALRGR